MATPSEAVLVDANVLVYSVFRDSEYHQASRDLLEGAQDGLASLCVTSQVLAEFYAVATDARRVDDPKQPAEVLQVIRDLLVMPGMTLIPTPVEAVPIWTTLARQNPVLRGHIFDVQLVGSMLANGVHKIYTFDRTGFEPFADVEVLTP